MRQFYRPRLLWMSPRHVRCNVPVIAIAGGRANGHARMGRVAYNYLFRMGKSSWKPNRSTSSPTRSRTSRNGRTSCGGIFDFDVKSERLAVVARELEDPKIWDDPQRAQELGREKKQLDGIVGTITELYA